MVAERGEIWWAAGRPVLVVQSDAFNQSCIGTVVVAVVTSEVALAAAPGNVLLRSDDSGLPRDSVVNVSRLLTIDKSALVDRAGRVPFPLLQQVDDGMRLVLAL